MADLIITAKDIPAGKAIQVLNPDGSAMCTLSKPNVLGGCGGYKTRLVPLADASPGDLPAGDDYTFALGRLLGKTAEEIRAEAATLSAAAGSAPSAPTVE